MASEVPSVHVQAYALLGARPAPNPNEVPIHGGRERRRSTMNAGVLVNVCIVLGRFAPL